MLENRVSRKIGLFAIVCAVVFAFAAGSRGEQITGGEGIARRTLPRQFDVIKVQGDLLGRFDGVPIKNLSLLAFKGGTLAPIPFQIDERDRKGRYVMTAGKAAGTDEDGGRLDPNDELVFLLKDAGDRLPTGKRAEGGNRIEIEMTDPRNQRQRAWAYLGRYNANPPALKPITSVTSPRKTRSYRKHAPSVTKRDSYFTTTYVTTPRRAVTARTSSTASNSASKSDSSAAKCLSSVTRR